MKNKKGIFFTILAILILSLILISYGFLSTKTDNSSIYNRISSMNNYNRLVDRDIQRHIYVSGYRVLLVLEKKISESRGSYITDIDKSFNESFFNGSIDGVHDDLMNGATYSEMVLLLNSSANKINLNINFLSPQFFLISQTDPWSVKVTFISSITISDRGNLASWNRSLYITTSIPIYNFEDPVYVLNTGGMWNKKINQSSFNPFVSYDASLSKWDTSNLSYQFGSTMYINSTAAPSFLDRLEGNLTGNNPNGIESFVPESILSSEDSNHRGRSVVDYIYFSNDNTNSYQVCGMPDDFYLDDNHLNNHTYDIPDCLRKDLNPSCTPC